jgi:hypothetical protein
MGGKPIVASIDGNLQFTGQLYWALDAYQYVKGHDPWNDVESNQGGTLYAGEGILMYPGADVGTRSIATDFHHWTYRADAIERVRKLLGAKLDRACAN